MIGLDTNVLIRYLTQDDPGQFREATRLLEALEANGESAHLSVTTMCEIVWVLSRGYKFARGEIALVVKTLLETALFVVEDRDHLREALALYESGFGDFADGLLGLRSLAAGCSRVATFDVALHSRPEMFVKPAAVRRASRRPHQA